MIYGNLDNTSPTYQISERDKYIVKMEKIIAEYKSENDMNDKYFQGIVNGIERALLEYQELNYD